MCAVSVSIPTSPQDATVLLLVEHEGRPDADRIVPLDNEATRALIANLGRALTISDGRLRRQVVELVLAAPSPVEPKGVDDICAPAALEPRLDRVEDAVRRQQRSLNSLTASFVERFSLPNGRYPSYCCQRCGKQIGWVGRVLQAIGIGLHACPTDRGRA